MRVAMATLHETYQRIIIDPLDDGLYHTVDECCYVIWEHCLMTGEVPWGWCADIYCSCKVALAEHEPEPLPGFGGAPGKGSED